MCHMSAKSLIGTMILFVTVISSGASGNSEGNMEGRPGQGARIEDPARGIITIERSVYAKQQDSLSYQEDDPVLAIPTVLGRSPFYDLKGEMQESDGACNSPLL